MSEELPENAIAVVIGAGGGIGAAVLDQLRRRGGFGQVLGFGRHSDPALDLLDEASIERAARHVAALPGELRLLFDASGFLHGHGFQPEKSWRDLDPTSLAHNFAVNAIGPALLMKHFLPLLPRQGKAVFATLSAKVGSIGDNQLGGWYGYRAAKAALNQLVHTAAIELKRSRPQAICVALHPGTVDTHLSAPFAKSGLAVRPPEEAAADLLAVIDGLKPEQTGSFFDYRGAPLPW
ncbi:MAG: SDR family NAD(P)-dependent oxidoreductase [Oceanibaculum nanhaiense]|uniref:SDR family NAD(P)-dependent oxidoreductase n=1 Tax=Oceanibaculum nanhaiense TaxID=1909734 RepID=UPI0025A3ACC4|nr:SDR family NAD(P)-dependent oxidoreductase [Oceanibaculum nanhaiense]MDM7947215.1 SDR family NAD(P)-dependent oxidoreductase [Oceanibaculum nanhaiense]